jgi:hypothetical protein
MNNHHWKTISYNVAKKMTEYATTEITVEIGNNPKT